MKKNLGSIDRFFRFILFNFTIGFPFYGEEFPEWFKITLLITAIVLLITLIIAVCPLYKIFKINTSDKT